jgi:ribosomal protein S21
MGVRVALAENEPIGSALKRFKKMLECEGVNRDLARRRSFIKRTQTRRAKEFQKKFKARKATLLAKMAGEQPSESSASELVDAFWKRTRKP